MTDEKPDNEHNRRKDDILTENRFTSLEKDRDLAMNQHKEVLGRLDSMGKYIRKTAEDTRAYLEKIEEKVCNSVAEISNRVTDALVQIGVNERAIEANEKDITKIKERPKVRWERWKRRLQVTTWVVVIISGTVATAYYFYRMRGGG